MFYCKPTVSKINLHKILCHALFCQWAVSTNLCHEVTDYYIYIYIYTHTHTYVTYLWGGPDNVMSSRRIMRFKFKY